MKLMFVLSRVPYPLEKGDKLRSFHQIRCLSKTNEIYLFCLTHQKIDPKAYAFLKPYCKRIQIIPIQKREYIVNIIKAFFHFKPFQTGYFFSKNAKKQYTRFEQEVNPDHIYCQFIRTVDIVKDSKITKTLDYQDALSKNAERRIPKAPFYLRPILQYEAKTLANYESFAFDFFNTHTIISESDKQCIKHPSREKIYIIPNGVDFNYFHPVKNIDKKYDLVFTGNMQYPPNIDAVLFLITKILPELRKDYPSCKVLIAGANPHHSIRRLSSERIIVSGWVDDIRKCYASAKIFAAPMQIGTGLQNKLLEAMAMGLPCITSPLANQALQAKETVEILTAETTEEYISCIKTLLFDQETAEKIALNGHEYVKSHFNWEFFCDKLNQILLLN